jgi:CBS domain-containing protein
VPITDIARHSVINTDPTAPLVEVADLMALNGVGSVVVTSTGTPVGIVTDRDVAVALGENDGDVENMTAGDVMSDEIHTVDATAGLFAVTALMAEEGVRRVPIVDDAELVGIVTLDDLLWVLTAELDNLSAVIAEESP